MGRRVGFWIAVLGAVALAGPAGAGWRSEGPFLGAVQDLAVDAKRPDTVYAATSHAGVWRSDDFGSTWALPGDGLIGWKVQWVEADPGTAGRVWAAIDSPGDPALYRSDDRGATWVHVTESYEGELTMLHPVGYRIAFAPSRPAEIWVPSTNLHYRTRDGGRSWSDFRVPGQDAYAMAVDPADARIVYAGGQGDAQFLSRSDDGGTSWKVVGRGLEGSVKILLVDPQRSGTLYATSAFNRLFKSIDLGESFVELPSPAEGTQDLDRLHVDPSDSNALWAATEAGLYRSRDGGQTWARSEEGSGRYLVRSVAFDPRNPRRMLAASAGGGVYRSEDGGSSWTVSSSGLAAGWIDELYGVRAGSVLYAQTSVGLYRREADGSWQEVFEPLGDDYDEFEPHGLLFERGAPQNLWLYYSTSAWRATDSGRRWVAHQRKEASMRDLLRGKIETEQFHSLAQDSGDPKVFYAGSSSNDEPGNAIWKSVDGGKTWKPSGSDVPNERVSSLVAGASGVVFAWVAEQGLYRTTDAGRSWSRVGGGLPDSECRQMAVDPTTPGRMFAAYEEGLFRSTDQGGTWAEVGSALEGEDLEAVLVDADGRAFAATFHGVFASSDGGTTWSSISDGLRHTDVRSLAISGPAPARLYAGTAGGSLWSIELP